MLGEVKGKFNAGCELGFRFPKTPPRSFSGKWTWEIRIEAGRPAKEALLQRSNRGSDRGILL